MYVSTDTRVYHGYTSVRAALSARVASSRAESLASSWMSSRGVGTGGRRGEKDAGRGGPGEREPIRERRGLPAWWGERKRERERETEKLRERRKERK